MRIKVLFDGQVPKDPHYPDANEDALVLAAEIGRLAISDGASESYDSKTWANALAMRMVRDLQLDATWLAEAIAEYRLQFDPAQMSWSKLASFERGSFATLLAIEASRESKTVEVFSVGDSLAVLLDNGELVDSFPYVSAQEFQQRPDLLCTNATQNDFLSMPDFYFEHHRTWAVMGRKNPVVLCMTDALGEWALRQAEEGRPMWEVLSAIRAVHELEALVSQERLARRMRVDDATLVTLSLVKTVDRDELPNS